MARSELNQAEGRDISVRIAFCFQSQKTTKEIMGKGEELAKIGSPCLLQPETLFPWLESLSVSILQGDPETRYAAILGLSEGLRLILENSNETECSKYISEVLRQGTILNEVVRGLQEMAAAKKCYLLPKDGIYSDGSGERELDLLTLCHTYSGLLSELAADKRARKFILAHFTNLVDVQLTNYYGSVIPPDPGFGFRIPDVELQTRLKIGLSILLLTLGKGPSKQFVSTLLRDAVAASEHPGPRLLDSSIIVLQKNIASLHLLDPSDVLAVVMRVLEGSEDRLVIVRAVYVLSHMLDQEELAFGQLVRRHGSQLFPCLLALALAAPATDEIVKVPAIAVLQRTHPKLRSDRLELGPEVIAKIEAVASKDRTARRKKLRFQSIIGEVYSSSPLSGVTLNSKSGSFKIFCNVDEEEVVTSGRNRADPRRKCSRAACENVEFLPREFKVCSRCRYTSYCSADCQKLAWKQGHKDECKTRPSGSTR